MDLKKDIQAFNKICLSKGQRHNLQLQVLKSKCSKKREVKGLEAEKKKAFVGSFQKELP